MSALLTAIGVVGLPLLGFVFGYALGGGFRRRR